VDFEPNKISVALTKAFIATEGGAGSDSSRVRDVVARLTQQVADTLTKRHPGGGTLHIEHIQDQVEIALMRAGEHEVARGYVLYREARAQERAKSASEQSPAPVGLVHVTRPDGTRLPLDYARLRTVIEESCAGLSDVVSVGQIFDGTLSNLYDGVAEEEVF